MELIAQQGLVVYYYYCRQCETMPRRVLILVLTLGVGLVAWLAALAAGERRLRTELREAKRELGIQRNDQAKERLIQLARRWPGRGDVEYWLGTSELAAGNSDAAFEAWSRVPAKAPEAGLAALASGRLAMDKFRFSVAERSLERAIAEPGETGNEARWLLGRLHWVTGRHDDYRRFFTGQGDRERTESRPRIFACFGRPITRATRSKGSGERSIRPIERHLKTTESGSRWLTWRREPVDSTMPPSPSRGASRLGPTTQPSGWPCSSGAGQPTGRKR